MLSLSDKCGRMPDVSQYLINKIQIFVLKLIRYFRAVGWDLKCVDKIAIIK